MKEISKKVLGLLLCQRGSVLGEYGIWIILIVVVAAAALTPLGNGLKSVFLNLCTQLTGSPCTASS